MNPSVDNGQHYIFMYVYIYIVLTEYQGWSIQRLLNGFAVS